MAIQSLPAPVVDHYREMQQLQRTAVVVGRRAWAEIDPGNLTPSWLRILPLLAAALGITQRDAAAAGSVYAASALARQGDYVEPAAFVDPAAFVGVATDGRELPVPLYAPVIATKQALARGHTVDRALAIGRGRLDRLAATTIADTGRAAASVDIAARASVGYTRMLNPPSCSRCAILAGRWYRWNAGFRRHPHCDCVHVPAKAANALRDEGLLADPYEYFRSLDTAEQDSTFGPAEARAIRDGADISQVVNARRGMTKVGQVPASRARTTTEGTSRRGNYGITARGRTRLTVDEIYQTAGTRTRALRMLEEHGYVLPGGQDPAGALRGQREGYGQLGRGGTRVGARYAIDQARTTGIRDPRSRATMTAAERRRADADAAWTAVRAGRNPYGRGSLSDTDRARAETGYRRFVLGLDGGDPALTS